MAASDFFKNNPAIPGVYTTHYSLLGPSSVWSKSSSSRTTNSESSSSTRRALQVLQVVQLVQVSLLGW